MRSSSVVKRLNTATLLSKKGLLPFLHKDFCGQVTDLTDADRQAILTENTGMARQALRILAGAYKIID